MCEVQADQAASILQETFVKSQIIEAMSLTVTIRFGVTPFDLEFESITNLDYVTRAVDTEADRRELSP